MAVMQPNTRFRLLARLVALVVLLYGIQILVSSLVRELDEHDYRPLSDSVTAVSLLGGLGCLYLANLLRREKFNAWVCAVGLVTFIILSSIFQFIALDSHPEPRYIVVRLGLPLTVLLCLIVSRPVFRVHSDMRGFGQAARIGFILLTTAFLYGVAGFAFLSERDFHTEIGLTTAAHQTIDQFGLTTDTLRPYTDRARLFEDSLSIISVGAVAYTATALFQPIRTRFVRQDIERERAERLLERYSGDADDFFKLWPHDKLYYFDKSRQAFLAYKVVRGVALVVGNPAGACRRHEQLINDFLDLCFVNDWLPAFIHCSEHINPLLEPHGFRLQRIGEEALLDVSTFADLSDQKYFRQIRSRLTKLGFSVEVSRPPHSSMVLRRLRTISDQWLQTPGRTERGFMLGYYDSDYLQRGPLLLLNGADRQIQGFVNLVPTFRPGVANYDLLRTSRQVPGNASDFLLLGLIDYLRATGYTTLNLGLAPLAGLSGSDPSKDTTVIDSALRFVYSNGQRLYSFGGLYRFKNKYRPVWQPRYIAYQGGVRHFTRIVTALNRAMKIK